MKIIALSIRRTKRAGFWRTTQTRIGHADGRSFHDTLNFMVRTANVHRQNRVPKCMRFDLVCIMLAGVYPGRQRGNVVRIWGPHSTYIITLFADW